MSGCRLFSIHPDSDFPEYVKVDVCESSIGGRAKYLCDRVNDGLRDVRYLLPTEARTRLSPFELRESIISLVVSIMVSSILPWKLANGTRASQPSMSDPAVMMSPMLN